MARQAVNLMAPERQPGGHPKGRSGRWCAPVPVKHSSPDIGSSILSLPTHVPVAQWTEHIVPNDEVIRSSRIGDAMARDSPGERRSAKPPDGFDTRRVSRPVVQGIRAAVS